MQRGVAAAGGERAVVEMGGTRHRQRRHARDRGLGARLLEVLSRAYGRLGDIGWLASRSSASSRCRPPISAASTTTRWRHGRISFSTVPLHRHDGREPQERLRGRHHLRRHQGHADRPHRRRCARPTSTRSRATGTSSACRTSLKNGGDEAESETPFLVVRIMHDGQTDIFATGVYLDSWSAPRATI